MRGREVVCIKRGKEKKFRNNNDLNKYLNLFNEQGISTKKL